MIYFLIAFFASACNLFLVDFILKLFHKLLAHFTKLKKKISTKLTWKSTVKLKQTDIIHLDRKYA